MKITLTTQEIARKLVETESFTWAGAMALAEYLENLEEDTGEEMELDPIAIRCDFSEYESLEDWHNEYFAVQRPGVDDENEDKEDREYIQDHGILIEFDGGIIVSRF